MGRALLSSLTDAATIKFLRARGLPVLVWPILALVLAAVGWFLLLDRLDAERRGAQEELRRDALMLARGYAGQIERTIHGMDQILLHVRYEWEVTGGELRLDEAKDRGLFPSSEHYNVAIIGRDGTVQTNTLGRRPARSAADRQYFTTHQQTLDDFLYIGMPALGRGSGKSVIHLSRKLQPNAGLFAGVIRASVSPHFLTADYDRLALKDHGMLGIAGHDGELRAVRTGAKVYEWNEQSFKELPRFEQSSGSIYLDGPAWFADGRSRYLGWMRLTESPVTTFVGIDVEEAMAPYRQQRAAAIRGGLVNTLGLLVFAAVATTLSLRLAWRKHQLELAHHAYRTATEGGSEGFYILRPVFGDHGAVVDFITVDCNEGGAQLQRMSRDDMIGKKLSEIFPGPVLDRRMSVCSQALRQGVFEGECEEPAGPAGQPRWVRLRAVRSGEDLAVTLTDVSEARKHMEELERRGNEDALTRLPNRHWVQTYLPKAIEATPKSGSLLAILFIDLDGFKSVNDTAGHEAGDEVLRHAARRLQLAVRPGDHVARLGGDEFVVILEGLARREEAAAVAERVLHAFRNKFRIAQGTPSVGASIGIAICPNDGSDAQTLLRNADIAMYSAKTHGKRHFRFFDARFYGALRERLKKEEDLRHAIEHDQFVMHYQPRVDISTGTLTSLEALVRWDHPTEGLVGPSEFIPLCEQSGLILDLGSMVIEKVCRQLAAWSHDGQAVVPVSVNVSSRQFNEANVSATIAAALSRHGIDASLIEVELTESSMMSEGTEVREALNAIQGMGVKLLVDDFGTGYSSLAQLQSLDFDVLKVDRAFTSTLENTEEGGVLFKAIITMAHALGMRVVAEGVENIEQVRILRALRCDEVQGYFVSRPLPPREVQSMLPNWSLAST